MRNNRGKSLLPEDLTEVCQNINCKCAKLTWQNIVLSNLLYMALLEQGGWKRLPPQALSNLNHSVILQNIYSHTCYEFSVFVHELWLCIVYITIGTNMPIMIFTFKKAKSPG